MGEGWAFTGGPPNASAGADVTLVEGRSFCVSDRVGDLGGAATHGLIVQDTRFVEHLVLTVDGDRLEPLGVEPIGPHAATFVTRRKPRAGLADSTLLVVRERYVGNGLVEDITLENLSRAGGGAHAGADRRHRLRRTSSRSRRAGPPRAQGVTSTAADGVVTLTTLHPAPRSVRRQRRPGRAGDRPTASSAGTWPSRRAERATISVRVEPSVDGTPAGDPLPRRRAARRQRARPSSTRSGGAAAPGCVRPTRGSTSCSRTCTDELAGLRITDPAHADRVILAAGAPWFMTVFGRDSLLTSWMLLPLDARVALGTLQVLAERQGTRVEPAPRRSRAASSTRSGSGLSPRGVRRPTPSTTAPSTRRRCSSCSWAS